MLKSLYRRIKGNTIKKQLLENPFFVIEQSATVFYQGIRSKEGCNLKVGAQSIVEGKLIFEREGASISIGDRTFIGGSNIIAAEKITIGNDVLIAWGCYVVDHNSHSLVFSERSRDVADWREGKKDWSNVAIKPVTICDKAWIGFNSLILKGVNVGEGAVVGAGSVVTRDVPPYTVVGGNPAKIIRELGPDER